MSNETGITVITPKSLTEAQQLSTLLSKSTLLPDALRGKEAEVLMTIMTGAELGMAPMQSIRAIDVIKGKPTLKAEAMVALVRRSSVCEYFVFRETSATRCVIETKRKGDPTPTTFSFSMEDAKAAGLASNDNYRKFPAALLRARASSGCCKMVYSDLLLGFYDPEELEPSRPSQGSVIDAVATSTRVNDGPQFDLLDKAIEAADTEAKLNLLVPTLSDLPKGAEFQRLRAKWGARRDALKANATAGYVPPPVEDVPFTTDDAPPPEPGSEG